MFFWIEIQLVSPHISRFDSTSPVLIEQPSAKDVSWIYVPLKFLQCPWIANTLSSLTVRRQDAVNQIGQFGQDGHVGQDGQDGKNGQDGGADSC